MSNSVPTQSKPTKMLMEKNNKDEWTKGRVEDGTLLYVNLQEGELAFGSDTERNLSVQVAVTKDTAENWKSVFPKNGCREVPNDQFTKSYKTEPPYPEEDVQHVLKLKSKAAFQQDNPERDQRAGELVPYDSPSRPKLYEIKDGKPVDVTMDTQPGNGSKGTVAFRATNNQYGTFPVLSGVLVTELVEQQQAGGVASDFGITEDTPSTRRIEGPATTQDDEGSGEDSSNEEPQQEDSSMPGFDDEGWM